jgi:hypothetical protein
MVAKAFRLCDTDSFFDENYTFRLNNKLQDVLSCNKIKEDKIDWKYLFEDLHDNQTFINNLCLF